MAKLVVSFMAVLSLALGFGSLSLSASTIQNGVLVASNDKCGGSGACGGEEKPVKKCAEGKCESGKCGGEDKPIRKCAEGKCADGKCGSSEKPISKCGGSKCGS